MRVKEQFDVLLQESRFNRQFSKGGGSLDRRLQNINLERENSGSERQFSSGVLQESVKRQDIDHIPRSVGLQAFAFNKRPEKQSLGRQRFQSFRKCTLKFYILFKLHYN